MKRREFVTRVPAVAAGVAVGGSVGPAEASGGRGRHEGASGSSGPLREAVGAEQGRGGFRLLDEVLHSDEDALTGRRYEMVQYVVECPYPVGSRAWMALADRDEDGDVVVYDEWPKAVPVVSLRTRRAIFPRFVLGEGETVNARAREVFEAVVSQGFDNLRGSECEWRVVHVEYRCPDGVEHTIAGLPVSWDPRLCLSVFVQGQID